MGSVRPGAETGSLTPQPTGILALRNASAVPPVDTISTSRLVSSRQNSTTSLLSKTETRARRIGVVPDAAPATLRNTAMILGWPPRVGALLPRTCIVQVEEDKFTRNQAPRVKILYTSTQRQ